MCLWPPLPALASTCGSVHPSSQVTTACPLQWGFEPTHSPIFEIPVNAIVWSWSMSLLLQLRMWYLLILIVLMKFLSHVWLFVTPWTIYPARLLCPYYFPGKNTEVHCHFLLQGIFPTLLQEDPPGDLPCVSCLSGRFFITKPPGKPHTVPSNLQNPF